MTCYIDIKPITFSGHVNHYDYHFICNGKMQCRSTRYMETGKRENVEQIPQEDDPQGKTGKVVSEQSGIEGQRKEVNVESYSKVAQVGQMLKDIDFPASKEKIIEHFKQQHSGDHDKEEILKKLEGIEQREYKNASDVTTAVGLVY